MEMGGGKSKVREQREEAEVKVAAASAVVDGDRTAAAVEGPTQLPSPSHAQLAAAEPQGEAVPTAATTITFAGAGGCGGGRCGGGRGDGGKADGSVVAEAPRGVL